MKHENYENEIAILRKVAPLMQEVLDKFIGEVNKRNFDLDRVIRCTTEMCAMINSSMIEIILSSALNVENLNIHSRQTVVESIGELFLNQINEAMTDIIKAHVQESSR